MTKIMLLHFVSVVENPGGLPFRTCMSHGPNYYRTFDGLEFQYRGRCSYLMYSDTIMSMTVEMIDCDSFVLCEKVSR